MPPDAAAPAVLSGAGYMCRQVDDFWVDLLLWVTLVVTWANSAVVLRIYINCLQTVTSDDVSDIQI